MLGQHSRFVLYGVVGVIAWFFYGVYSFSAVCVTLNDMAAVWESELVSELSTIE